MAKKEVDLGVSQLMSIKPFMTQVRGLASIICFDRTDYDIAYLVSDDNLPIERLLMITEPIDIQLVQRLLINVSEYSSENKYIKKTKSVSENNLDCMKVISDTDDGPHEWIISRANDSQVRNLINYYYRIFGKDETMTREILDCMTNPTDWYGLAEDEMYMLRNGELIYVSIEDYTALISKAIFGNVKKTIGVEVHLLERNKDNCLCLIKQIEEGFHIYHICRFLKEDKSME